MVKPYSSAPSRFDSSDKFDKREKNYRNKDADERSNFSRESRFKNKNYRKANNNTTHKKTTRNTSDNEGSIRNNFNDNFNKEKKNSKNFSSKTQNKPYNRQNKEGKRYSKDSPSSRASHSFRSSPPPRSSHPLRHQQEKKPWSSRNKPQAQATSQTANEKKHAPKEICIYGEKAVNALITIHPHKILRFFYSQTTARRTEKRLEQFLQTMSTEKKVFRNVEDSELEKLSGSKHHQGMVAIIKKPHWNNVRENDIWQWQENLIPLVILQEVSNPHNLGAILRSAAFFGFTQIILQKSPKQAMPSAAVWKNASGGMELLNVYLEENLPRLLQRLQQSHYIAAADAHGERLLTRVIKEENRPFALVLGNEEDGLSQEVKENAHALVSIHGKGNLDSLNVSNAAAVFFQQIFQHTTKKIVLKRKSNSANKLDANTLTNTQDTLKETPKN